MGGGGVDGAIHRVAGKELLVECRKLKGCKTGHSKITNAYNLPSRYIIHTVGPVWSNKNREECNLLLASCYKTSCEIALTQQDIKSIAFPSISTGIYHFPFEEATDIAIKVCSEFMDKLDITFCCFSKHDYDIYISKL